MNEHHHKAMSLAVSKVLRPLIRILLRNGVAFGVFAELAKWIYVDVAMQEHPIEGRKQSTSRVSILTGLSRKEVKRLKEIVRPENTENDNKYNRAARIQRHRPGCSADPRDSAVCVG